MRPSTIITALMSATLPFTILATPAAGYTPATVEKRCTNIGSKGCASDADCCTGLGLLGRHCDLASGSPGTCRQGNPARMEKRCVNIGSKGCSADGDCCTGLGLLGRHCDTTAGSPGTCRQGNRS